MVGTQPVLLVVINKFLTNSTSVDYISNISLASESKAINTYYAINTENNVNVVS